MPRLGNVENLKPRHRRGRVKGRPNNATLEIRELSRRLVHDRAYLKALQQRLIDGTAPHMEVLLHHYAYGKPPDKIQVSGADGQPLSIHLTWGEALRPEADVLEAEAFPLPVDDADVDPSDDASGNGHSITALATVATRGQDTPGPI